MTFFLSLFSIFLPLTIYPMTQLIPPELMGFWGIFEMDLFNWYRMWLVGSGTIFLVLLLKRFDWKIVFYLTLLLLSYFRSPFHEILLTGTPDHHEGLIALLGYVGIYLVAKEVGIIEKTFRAVVWIALFFSVLQIHYGNFIDFPPVKAILPNVPYEAVKWPLYSVFGNQNHLGLFCSLMLPFCIGRRLWIESLALSLMLIGSGTERRF